MTGHWNQPDTGEKRKLVTGHWNQPAYTGEKRRTYTGLWRKVALVMNLYKLNARRFLSKLHPYCPRGLTREFSPLFKPTFYPCTLFHQPRPLLEGALSCCWPAINCIGTVVTRDNSIVYGFTL